MKLPNVFFRRESHPVVTMDQLGPRQVNGWSDGWTEEHMECRQVEGGQMGGLSDPERWMDGWVDGWIGGNPVEIKGKPMG